MCVCVCVCAQVDALWTLCQFEAGVLEVPDRACRLFTAADVSLLEWVDDVSLSESQGWGSEVNYRIAAPLLQDLRATLLVRLCSHARTHVCAHM